MKTKVCGGTGYVVEVFRTSLGHGDAWIKVPVRCYMECNSNRELVCGLKPMGTPIPVAIVSGNKDGAQKKRKATDPLMKKDIVRKKKGG